MKLALLTRTVELSMTFSVTVSWKSPRSAMVTLTETMSKYAAGFGETVIPLTATSWVEIGLLFS